MRPVLLAAAAASCMLSQVGAPLTWSNITELGDGAWNISDTRVVEAASEVTEQLREARDGFAARLSNFSGMVAAMPYAVGDTCDQRIPNQCCSNRPGGCKMQCMPTTKVTASCTAKCFNSDECQFWASRASIVFCSHEVVNEGTSGGYCAVRDLLWVVGVGMCFCGMLLSSVGTQLLKKAHSEHDEGRRVSTRWWLVYFSPLYLIGITGMVSGAVLDLLSLAFAPQSLLAPIAACTLVVNMCVSPHVVGEEPAALDIFATMVRPCLSLDLPLPFHCFVLDFPLTSLPLGHHGRGGGLGHVRVTPGQDGDDHPDDELLHAQVVPLLGRP